MNRVVALVSRVTAKVLNVIVINDDTDLTTFQNFIIVDIPDRPEVGWAYDGTSFAPSVAQDEPVTATFDADDAADLKRILAESDLSQDRIRELTDKLTR